MSRRSRTHPQQDQFCSPLDNPRNHPPAAPSTPALLVLLGLKGTMSEYELNLLRQRGLAVRDVKAGRGELRFTLPPGDCWSEDDRIELDPDQRSQRVIHLIFAKMPRTRQWAAGLSVAAGG